MKIVERLLYALIGIGLVGLFVGGTDTFNLLKPEVDLYDTDWDDLKNGMHVSADVELVWDCVIQETSQTTYNGVATGEARESARYYAIPLISEDDDYINVEKLIAIKVSNSDDYETLEDILDETNDWWFDETGTVGYGYTTFHIEGILHKMDSEEESYMREYVEDSLIDSSDDAEDYYVPFYLEKVNPGVCFGATFFGIVCVAVGVVGLVFYFKKKKEEDASMMYRPNSNMGTQRDYYNGVNTANTYQSNSVYNNVNTPVYGSTATNGAAPTMWESEIDPATGLSKDFLNRSAAENQPAQPQATPDMGTNPLYGTQTNNTNQ